MNKTFAMIVGIALCLTVFGAATALWYSEFLQPQLIPTLKWNASTRSQDVLFTLVCAFDDTHTIDNPNWHTHFNILDPDDAAYYPPIGSDTLVSLDVSDVVAGIGQPHITFAVSYVDDWGNMSEWVTVEYNVDTTPPNKAEGVQVVEE